MRPRDAYHFANILEDVAAQGSEKVPSDVEERVFEEHRRGKHGR